MFSTLFFSLSAFEAFVSGSQVLVSAETIEVELFRRLETDDWRIINYQAGDTVELKSVNLTFPIEQLYEDIVFPEPEI